MITTYKEIFYFFYSTKKNIAYSVGHATNVGVFYLFNLFSDEIMTYKEIFNYFNIYIYIRKIKRNIKHN